MPKELEQVKEIIELRKRMDKQQKPIVKKLGDEIGYGRLMQLTEEMWREKAEFKGSELAVGACVSFMVICDHSIKDDNGHCKLCCGAGRVTKGVKDLADELRGREWQPIETAPKDGPEILITASGEVYAASWKCGEWRPIDQDNYYSEWDGFKEGVIIKWQHLPQPPKEQIND